MFRKVLLVGLLVWLGAITGLGQDVRVLKLEKFLAQYPWSPLQGHEQEIVYCADQFGLDYRIYVALAGAESTFGKRFPQHLKNLTGYNNCKSGFASIWDNIYSTSKLIGTAKYYRKYRYTRDLWDLVYTYKGVSPYKPYYKTLMFTLKKIEAIKIADANLAKPVPPQEKPEPREKLISSWGALRYDQLNSRTAHQADLGD
ncbi:hypothetical protein COT42_04305 [Candidatus Saganbacteria bacterium CG08_land_8_20_14_0_20_45_16]|uniref:Mannosyl-glycoprotein endo-beta-N-acetylglucosamidase-like domain-containing protein n=1 Tax=Candidatus Saganbacteria bacterium CG08_land_8_20_14_0_20_45_16 TaxID=2014293 RepID=A0A2H0XY81_UNCSA|nr:MAG: hypothetical protein COT42_04305 [Candidatus Saganbacteria bacterium CG08_land_8_20_14_0_20_45_16]